MQCHLETTSSPLPAALLRNGRGVFSYRPGEPLGNYILNFDHAPGTGHDDKFEIVSAAYRFRKSPCFEAGLACTSCHDPHQAASREEILHKTQTVCLSCHASHSTSADCATCHMPLRRPADSTHMLMTDHRIVARPAADAEPDAMPYSGEVALYYPRNLASTPENALNLAIAQVKDLSNLPEGLQRLERAIAQYRPAWARPYYEMGQALVTTGQPAKALPYFEEAVKRDPADWRYLFSLGGIDALERARKLAPEQAVVLDALGSAYAKQGNLPLAAATFRQALSRNPEGGEGQAHLGAALLRMGDIDAAVRVLREAVRLRPEVADIRINLAVALIKAGKLLEARRELEEAVRAGPAIEVARAAWFTALAANASPKEARVRYDASLRSQLTAAYSNLGTVLALLGDNDAALRAFRLAVDSDPQSEQGRMNLALALERLKGR